LLIHLSLNTGEDYDDTLPPRDIKVTPKRTPSPPTLKGERKKGESVNLYGGGRKKVIPSAFQSMRRETGKVPLSTTGGKKQNPIMLYEKRRRN